MCVLACVKLIRMQIIIYCNSQGKEPYTEWLNQLNDAAGKRFIRAALRKLTLGNTSPLKRLKGDERLWEIRIMNQGPGYRVYCLREQETLIILWGGYKEDPDARHKKGRL